MAFQPMDENVLLQLGLDPSMKENTEVKLRRTASFGELEDELIKSGGSDVLLTDVRKGVLALTPSALRQKLRDGNLSAVLVLESFQAKAIEESKRTNCITEFIPDAKKWAESLDAIKFGQISDVQLPLHGMPVSIKDNINIEGLDSTLGLRKRVDSPAEYDAIIVQVLKKLGAIPFVKTNVPQLCLSIGCSNPIWGETVNPHNTLRTSGGSSGGEAALIGGGGSFLGFGTDVGGSIRVPAQFCGIVGLKPTARRISNKGVANALPGLVGVYSSAGVMGRDAPIVVEATKALLSGEFNQYDSEVPPVVWNEQKFSGQDKKALRIGWFDEDGIFPSTPGVKRAINETVQRLRAQNHELIPFTLPDAREGLQLYMDLLMADNGTTAFNQWKGETVDQCVSLYKQASHVPAHLKNVTKPLIKRHYGDIAAESCIGAICSTYDIWKRNVDRAVYIQTFLKAWKKEELDLILCPAFPMPAPPTEIVSKLTPAAFCCMLFNLMDFPAATLPVTYETDEDQNRLEDYVTTDTMHEIIKEGTKGASGVPLGVQVVALPYCEEVLCRVMMDISRASSFKI